MDALHLLTRDRKHPERVIVAQVLFNRERKLGQIGQLRQVIWVNPRRVKAGLVMRHVFIGMPQRPFQPLQLQRGNLVAAGNLDRVEAFARWSQIFHAAFSSNSAMPWPTPMHMVQTARFRSSFIIVWEAVSASRAPDMPSG